MLAGRYRVGRPLPSGDDTWRVEITDERDPDRLLEGLTPKVHARMRPGAREAFLGASPPPGDPYADLACIERDGFFVRVRPRSRGTLADLARQTWDAPLLDRVRARVEAGDGALDARDLLVGEDGSLHPHRSGIVRDRQVSAPPTLALLLEQPAAVPAVRSTDAIRAPVPRYVVLVHAAAGDHAAVVRTALRSGSDPKDVRRAFDAGGAWAFAGADSLPEALRERSLAGRVGLAADLHSTAVVAPTFLPAMLNAGLAQAPVLLSSGAVWVDVAVASGFGVVALFSLLRNVRRIAPSRAAARAVEAWRVGSPGATADRLGSLHRLSRSLAASDLPGPARLHLGGALDAAWEALLLATPGPAGASARAGTAHDRAVAALHAAAEDCEEALGRAPEALHAAVLRLQLAAAGIAAAMPADGRSPRYD